MEESESAAESARAHRLNSPRPLVQSGARRDGNAGICGNPGIVQSATCRIQRTLESSNPTLSAKCCLLFSFIYKDESHSGAQ
jgi:hypothetical protein